MGEFWNPRGQHDREEKKQKNTLQIRHLTAPPREKVAQMLASTSSERGLIREVWAALLRVRNGPECPEHNLRELT